MNFSRIIRGSLEVSVRLALALPWPQVVAGGVACAALVAGGFFGLRPDLWLVERVEFSGASRIRSSELRHLLDLPNGTAMWQVEPGALEHALERHPWVRGATATVVWPATVHVDIVERSAVALLHDGERLLYVDQEGTPFLPADFRTGAQVDLDLVHLTGMGSELADLHPDLAPRAIRDALWLVHELDERDLCPSERVSEVTFSRTSGFVVVAPPSRLLFGLSELPAQVDRLERLVDGGLALDEPRHVDLAPATVAIVRPLGAGSPATPTDRPAPPTGG